MAKSKNSPGPDSSEFIFWKFTDKGPQIQYDDYIYFLNKHGFFQMRLGDKSDNTSQIVFVHIKDNVIDMVDTPYIKKYVTGFFIAHETIDGKNTRAVKVLLMTSSKKYFNSEQLAFLPFFNGDMLEETKTTSYAFFSNTVVKITPDEVLLIPYSSLPGHIWKSAVQNRPFTRTDGKNCKFREFMQCISTSRIDDGKMEERFKFNCSVYGYLLHNYKDETNAKAVILTDMKLPKDGQDAEEGGTGKGIFGRSTQHFRKYHWVDGKVLDSVDDKFIYQNVTPDIRIIFIDDVNKKFDFLRFFNNITGDMLTEQKRMKPILIKFKDSAKMIFSSNYAIKSNSTSTLRRKVDVEFTDFFDATNQPNTHLGVQLFTGFNDFLWNEYYNFCINCLQHYLINGMKQIDTQSVDTKRLIANYGYEFYSFWKIVKKSGAISKKDFYDKFMDYSGYEPHQTSKKRITDMVKAYFKYEKMELRAFPILGIPCYIFPDYDYAGGVISDFLDTTDDEKEIHGVVKTTPKNDQKTPSKNGEYSDLFLANLDLENQKNDDIPDF
jgi:hypothetical protein